MATTDTPTAVVNEAVMMMGGNQPLVTGTYPNFDPSTTGKAAALLYGPAVAAVGRQFAWDFGRNTVALVLSGNAAPFPWSVQYLYPSQAIQVWQLMPPALADANNPLPINWAEANDVVSAAQARVINANLAGALAVINNNPLPSIWDSLFHQAVVRLLSSAMAMAIAGKPDVAQSMLSSGAAFESLGEGRDS